MITSAILIWLYFTLNKITLVTSLISVAVLGLALFTRLMLAADYGTKDERTDSEDTIIDNFDSAIRLSSKIFIIALVLNMLIPSTKDLQYIIGGAVAIEIAKSEEARKLPDNVLKSVNTFLEGFNDSEKVTTKGVE